MDDLIDLIVNNESPTEIHSKIKDVLFAKSAENIETIRPAITADMFGGPNPWVDQLDDAEPETDEVEASAEVEEPAEEPEEE
tara:strand:- start:377 stop:622 length:246 start_codon:yes stop_codon:yes gene_type:complete